ncbi:MAG: HAMP domain-containing histidine kinase [Bdellovibrionales bacterium]|nr:HAMP domain-containing histidine kinase [Bdellovibrionales bacterium]
MTLKKYLTITSILTTIFMMLIFSGIIIGSYNNNQDLISQREVKLIEALVHSNIDLKKAKLIQLSKLFKNDSELSGKILLKNDLKEESIVSDYLSILKQNTGLSSLRVLPIEQEELKNEQLRLFYDNNSIHVGYITSLELFGTVIGYIDLGLPLEDDSLHKLSLATGSVINLGLDTQNKIIKNSNQFIKIDGFDNNLYAKISIDNMPVLKNIFSTWLKVGAAGVFIIILLSVGIYYVVSRNIIQPVEDLTQSFLAGSQKLKLGELPVVNSKKSFKFRELKTIAESYVDFTFSLRSFSNRLKEKQKNQVLLDIARQVAHDIRSPLSALNMSLSILKNKDDKSPEAIKMIARSTKRINEIANDLLNRSKVIEKKYDSVHLCSAIENLVHEKSIQFHNHEKIDFKWDLDENSYDLFVKAEESELMRVVSNVLNNAVESYNGLEGSVFIQLFGSGEDIVLFIEDQGCGIPQEIMSKIFVKGFSYQKKNGSGMGLYHAKKTIEALGGQFELGSSEKGTSVTITLPKTTPPDWFTPSIEVKRKLIVADDDAMMHSKWKSILKNFLQQNPNLQVEYVSSLQELTQIYNCSEDAQATLLIDYNFSQERHTGLDFIKEFGLKNAILVTNSYDDPDVVESVTKNEIQLIPKPLISAVPIRNVS